MADVIAVEVFNKIFASIAEEMGIILAKSSFSSNIKERRDFSCAIFDRNGELVSQAAHIPVHLGAMPLTIQYALAAHSFADGDIMITNDPFMGGSHLPDITLIEAVTDDSGNILFYVASRAHHADVGGKMPASMGMNTDIADEGIRISPTLFCKRGVINQTFFQEFLSQVRNPEERQGDLHAQTAALQRGKKRLREISAKYSIEYLYDVINQLKNYAERLMKSIISGIPNGTYDFCDYLDDDGRGSEPLPIHVSLLIKDDQATADFSSSGSQIFSPLNTVKSVTRSALVYIFQCLVGEGYPVNEGSYRPLELITQPGTLTDAQSPAPVAAGNVETSQRIVDTLFGALAQAIPDRIPAASSGSMNNIAISNCEDSSSPFSYYETIGGGMGARPSLEGLHGIHTHMTNTMNTPIEALERVYPFEIAKYSLRKNSGGKGQMQGGDGIIRTYLFQENSHVSLLTERRKIPPYGLHGGKPGKVGENILIRRNQTKRMAGKVNFTALTGDKLIIKSPAGGGWGIYRN